MKTSELTGAALDWAVAKCEGNITFDGKVPLFYTPSNAWLHGGPIIEREFITLQSPRGTYWQAELWTEETNPITGHFHYGSGPTPLIAAMQCFVQSKLGDEVEIPHDLTI